MEKIITIITLFDITNVIHFTDYYLFL